MGVLCATVLLFPAGAAEGAPAGRVVAWGCQDGGNWGQCNIPSGLTTVTAVADSQLYAMERSDFVAAVTSHSGVRAAGEEVVEQRHGNATRVGESA